MFRKTVVDGEVIIRRGEVADAAWRVASGAVLVRGPGPDGQLREMLADAGDVIGAVAALDGARYDQTAEARGTAIVEMLPREELVRLLTASPDAAGQMLAPLFSAAAEAEAGAAAATPPASGGGADAGPAAATVRLYGMEAPLAALLGPGGIDIEEWPFIVGRKESEDDDGVGRGVQLTLPDNRPFHLSRRHFAIEHGGDGWIARDCGSFHGTYVNGLLVGSSEPARSARLVPGDNEIVAGALNSPFRFRVAVPG